MVCYGMGDDGLDALLALDGAVFEMAQGVLAAFAARRTQGRRSGRIGSATRWCCGPRRVARRGCGSTTHMPWARAASDAVSVRSITGTDRRAIAGSHMDSPLRHSCLRISGARFAGRSMKEGLRMTYRIGSLGEFAAWTKSVVRDPAAGEGVAKTWFDSEATAARAATDQVSAEAMVKLLSPGNLAVLEAIRRHRPGSVRELAALTGRKEASLSRTLKQFAALRIIGFSDGPGRTRVPSLLARRVRLEIDLTGAGSAVAVEG